MSAAAAEMAQEHFGTGPVSAIDPLPSHSHAFLVSARGSRYVLKCMSNWEMRPVSVETTHNLVRFLNQEGFCTYSLVPATFGRTWVHSRGFLWELHTYIAGYTPGSLRFDPPRVGRLLAEYHAAAEAFVRVRFAQPRSGAASSLRHVDPTLALRALASRVWSSESLDQIDGLVALSQSLVQGSVEGDRVLPLHNDISESNIVISASRCHLIDFEDTVWGDPGLEVAQALARMASREPHQTVEDYGIAVRKLLSAYAESSGYPGPSTDLLRTASSLHAIKDWACDQLCFSLPDQLVPEQFPSLLCTLDLLSRCIV